jgi:hypothetical protein
MPFEQTDKEFLKKWMAFVAIYVLVRSVGEAFLLSLAWPIQFIIGTLLFYALFPILLYGIKKLDMKQTIGSIAILAALDLYSVPALVSTAGAFTGGETFLGTGTIDYLLYSVFSPYVSGTGLYFTVYAIGGVALMALGLYLVTEHQVQDLFK